MLHEISTQETIDDCAHLHEVRARLDGWGAWQRATKLTRNPLSLPTRSNFVSVPTGTTEYSDAEAEQLERILVAMVNTRTRALQFRVLCCVYVYDMGYRDGSKKLRISEHAFKKAQMAVENYLAGVLSTL